VALLAMIAAVVIPRYNNSLCSYRAARAASRLAADLAMARNDAWACGTSRTVTLDTVNNQYQLTGIPDPDHKTQANTTVSFAPAPYCATLVSSTFQNNTITFNGYGTPSAGGQIVLSAGAYSKTVVLDAVTGHVSLP
jgi:Tfp pilus assembly protein FimT